MQHVQLDAPNRTVRFAREGVMFDLGAIGKGYAVSRAVEILRNCGVASALIHGGTSTIYAIGHPPEAEFWKIAIEKLPNGAQYTFYGVHNRRAGRSSKVSAPNLKILA